MDRNDPPIIKSGARHSVQVAQGTRNAKSVRNVVTSDADEPLQDRIVLVDDTVEREVAALQQGQAQEPQSGPAKTENVLLEAQAASTTNMVVVEPSPSAIAGDGVAFDPSSAHQPAGTGPSVLREERAAQDGLASKSQPEAEHRILVDAEPAPADTEGVVIEARQAPENWQRIEQLQAQANRIRLEAEQRPSADPVHARPGERSLRTHEVPPELAEAAPPAGPPADAPVAGLPPVEAAQQPLPPEVVANVDHQAQATPAAGAKESALMARLRALKSNMSVTENRLTKLKTPDTPDNPQ